MKKIYLLLPFVAMILIFVSCQPYVTLHPYNLNAIKQDVIYTFSMSSSVGYDENTYRLESDVYCPMLNYTKSDRDFHYPDNYGPGMDRVMLRGNFPKLNTEYISSGQDFIMEDRIMVMVQTNSLETRKYIENWMTYAIERMGGEVVKSSDYLTSRAAYDQSAIQSLLESERIDKLLRISVEDLGFNRLQKQIAVETVDTKVEKGKPVMNEDSTTTRDTKRTETVTTTFKDLVKDQYGVSYILETIDTRVGYPKYEAVLKNSVRLNYNSEAPFIDITLKENDQQFCNFALYHMLKDGVLENRGSAITTLAELSNRIRSQIDFGETELSK